MEKNGKKDIGDESMKSKLLFLTIAMILIFPSITNAVLNDAYAYLSGDNSENIEGNKIKDLANTTHNFTNSSALSKKNLILGEAYQFTVSPSRYITMNKKLNYSGTWTMRAWINSSSDGATDQSIIRPVAETGDNAMLFASGAGNDNKARCLSDAAVDKGDAVSTSSITGVPTMVVCRFNGTHMNIYINKTLEAIDTQATPDDVNTDIFIGAHSPGDENFIGVIDEVGIWERPLDMGCNAVGQVCTGEIADLFNNGAGFNPYAADTTPPAVNITNFNTTIKKNDRLNISCQSFDTATIGNITFNLTGNADLYNFSFSLSGASANYSQNITMNLTRGNVVNSTCWASDSSGNLAQNSTLITIANTIPTHTAPLLNSSDGLNRTNANLTGFNQSGADADGDIIVNKYKWYKNNVSNATRWINDSSLLLYLPFDGNTTLDFARGNDGTAMGGANGTPEGKVNGAYMFDGVNDHINVSNPAVFNFGTNSFSFSAWIKADSLGVTRVILDKSIVSGNHRYSMILSDNNLVDMRVSVDPAIATAVDSSAISANVWYHFVGVRDGAGSVKLYRNGVLVGSDSQASINPDVPTDSLHVGTWKGGGYFNGTIDEVMVYNKALSASEVQQIFRATSDGFAVLDSDQTARGENWTIEMTPYDEIEAGIPLNSTLITIANTIPTHTTPILNATDYPNNKTTANLTGYNQSSFDADSDQIISGYKWYKNKVLNATRFIYNNSLVLYLPFDENSTKDFSNYSNDGTAFNGANGTPEGKIGSGYMFDGNNDYVDAGNAASLDITGSITLEGWIKPTGTGFRTIVSKIASGDTSGNYIIQFITSGKIRFGLHNPAGTWKTADSTGTVSNDVWTHIAVTFSRPTVSYYFNGVLDSTKTIDFDMLATTANAEIGAYGGATNPYNGTIDEIKIYNKSLTDNEIAQIYRGTKDGFAVLDSDQTSRGDNWTIEMTPYDEIEAGIPLNSTNITIADTVQNAPTIINPTLNTLYTTSNIDFNITWLLDADADAVTNVYWWVNATSKTNQSISVSGGNTGNTTFNASDGKYNLTVSICDAFGCSTNTTIASFKIDTVTPTTNLTTALPNMTFIRTNTNYTIGAEDSNLEVHNVSCVSGDDIVGTMRFSSEANLTGIINTFNLEINTSWGDGRYTCLSNASDDHTTTINKNYSLTKDIATLKLDFLTSESKDDIISIKLKSSDIGLLDFYAYKSQDETKYIYIFNFSNTTANSNINHTYVIKYSSKNHKLSYRSQSKFKSHFTTPYNWIDCNLRTNYSELTSYSVKEAPANSGQFETTITTPETTLICDSIGGKNRIGQRTQAEIDTGLPQFFSLNVSRNGLRLNNTFFNNQTLNFTFNVSDKNINSTLFYVNGVKNISSLVIASNSTQNSTITLTDGNYSVLMEINDSAGNKINSTLLNVVVDTEIPTFKEAVNRTAITNSTTITTATDVNITIRGLGDIYLNRGNFSHNASGSWTNHSISILGNNTYHYVIGSGNFSSLQIIGWKFYAYDLAGNELDPIYTFEVGSPSTTPTTTGGGSSSGGSFNLDQLECNQKAKQQNRCLTYNPDSKFCDIGCQSGFSCNEDFVCEGAFLQPDYIPLANLLVPNLQEEQCLKQGYSFFQDSCFNCAGKLANLKGTIVCLQCKEGYRLDDNNVCVQTLQQRTQAALNPIDKLARKISPNNPFLGYMLMIGVAGITIYAYSNRTVIKTKFRRS